MTIQIIITFEPGEGIVGFIADNSVIFSGSWKDGSFDFWKRKRGTIGETDAIDGIAVIRDTVTVKIGWHPQGVVSAVDINHQVVPGTAQSDISGIQFSQRDDIHGIRVIIGRIINGVLTGAFAKAIGVGAVTTAEVIVTRTTIEDVVSIISVQGIITGKAE